ncbi:hypothetical protein CMV_017573, partial [Castanea mollissima]
MVSSFTTMMLMIMIMWMCLCTTPFGDASSGEDFSVSECLKVPTSEFLSSVKTTIDAVQTVVSIISPFTNLFGDLRVSNAIADCLDLLDFSADELALSLSASQNPKGNHNSTGDLSFRVSIIDDLDNSVTEAVDRVSDLFGPKCSQNLEFHL